MAATDRKSPDTTGFDQLREEAVHYLGAQLEHLVDKAGDKVSDLTGQLGDVVENGGVLPKVGARVLQGDSPARAFLGEKAKSIKDNVVDKVKGAFGGGKPGRKSGKKPMNIIETIDVGVPLRTAYDHWTTYEDFSGFTKGVQSVSQGDEVTTDWKVKVGPSKRSFKATVQEQIPDDRIVWTSEGAKGSTRGAISFHELTPTLTRIVLVVEYYPAGFFEKTGNIWRAQGRRMRLDLKHFQRHVSLSNDEVEGWRGEIRDGEVVRTHDEVMEEESAEEEQEDDFDAEFEDEGDEPEDGEFDDEEFDDEEEGEGEQPEDDYDEEREGDESDEQEPEDEEFEDEDEWEAEEDETDPTESRATSHRRR
ncbi:SRPBCC family protein [Streptacidiphilus jiangxiensis]|uniref:Polyketide cyclase / dehydrase and lipid transport n=1 Tax=Streptacidiphilus jiangxiensis TaxID=235985 RepID=A0A1H7NTX2_STRJI|nr:SRPBCC family protein [Streptacidiphilus jiangxiensis]SEL26871.1 Polyketide cyclase / dehydrase and lipid transport [Streptacidiphilus jiangxiensis]